MELYWNPDHTDPALHDTLLTLEEEYDIHERPERTNLVFRKSADPECLNVTCSDETVSVEYGRDSLAARGIAYALAGRECHEKVGFKTFGILFDCTRGNVITVDYFKHWLRRIAMMGCNMAMIYVKDAYQLPGESYFGYMRGAYSIEEMQEVDAYAKKLHIEMIASIQALGHVEPALRWPAYASVSDTPSVMLVDEPKTYVLIRKMLEFWSKALSSRRIHLGMDETASLGRGRFMDLHGAENPFDIYNRHLTRVCEMCKEFQFEPIIWADMFFAYGSKTGNQYDSDAKVPEEVSRAIPKMVQLSYWDYYHRDEQTYESNLLRTSALNGSTPFMASGIWTWMHLWCDYEQSAATVRPCIDACHKTGAKEIIFTLWGDDGGYCDFDSAFAGLAWAADYAYNDGEDHDRAAAIFQAICKTDYDRQLVCGDLCLNYHDEVHKLYKVEAVSILWDDPLMGIVRRELEAVSPKIPQLLLDSYQRIMDATAAYRDDTAAGHIDYAWNIANVLTQKIRIRLHLEQAYASRNMAELSDIASKDIPVLLSAIDDLLDAFRVQWKRSFKSYGLELMQIRLGGQTNRYRELKRVIEELIRGEISAIPELDDRTPVNGNNFQKYSHIATGCFFI